MAHPFSKLRGALTDVLNEIDDARDNGLLTDLGETYLSDIEDRIESIVNELDGEMHENHDS